MVLPFLILQYLFPKHQEHSSTLCVLFRWNSIFKKHQRAGLWKIRPWFFTEYQYVQHLSKLCDGGKGSVLNCTCGKVTRHILISCEHFTGLRGIHVGSHMSAWDLWGSERSLRQWTGSFVYNRQKLLTPVETSRIKISFYFSRVDHSGSFPP